jgi:predicted MPP superfamily phosphohydrolase
MIRDRESLHMEAELPLPPRRMNRRHFLKHGVRWIAALAGIGAGAGAYSVFLERHWLEVHSTPVMLAGLPHSFHGLRIVQFSDLHLGHYFEAEDVIPFVERINMLAPAMICFTGDLVDRRAAQARHAIDLLSRLHAPLGKFAVLGNHDYAAGPEEVADLLTKAGFTVMNNDHIRLEREGNAIYVAGVEDMWLGQDAELACLSEAIPFLAELKAPLGKYAVLGNHDYRTGAEEVAQALEQAGFQLLINRRVQLRRGEELLYLVGIDDALCGRPDPAAAMQGIPEDGCAILLVHEPDFADEAKDYPVSLQLSGHSHGGQIRLPVVGHLLVPHMGKKYPDGLKHVEQADLHVYTSRGVGTTLLPLRILCKPEIALHVLLADEP